MNEPHPLNPRQFIGVVSQSGATYTRLVVGDIDGLRAYLDKLTITPDNIGQIRRSLFIPGPSEWNAAVRNETAEREVNRDAGNKPPLGVEPRYLWVEQRRAALREAIQRYCTAGLVNELVFEWIDELRGLA